MRRAALLVLAALFCVPAASAGVAVKSLDSGAYPRIRVSVVTSERTASTPALTENGHFVSLTHAENLGRAKSVVLALDRSRSMKGKAFADAIAAARAFVAGKAPDDRISIIGFGSEALQLTPFSSATIDTDSALRTLTVDPDNGTALYDGLVAGSRALQDETFQGRVIIVLTDGRDVSSRASLAQATDEAKAAGAAIYAIAIESPQFSPGPLRELATSTGGAYRGTTSSAALGSAYEAIAAELSRTWKLEYATTARPGDLALLRAESGGAVSVPARLALATSLGPRTTAKEPSRLLPNFIYETVLGTQLMALITGLMVLLAASLALTTVKGARLRRRIAPHLATSVEKRRREEQKERFAAAAGLFRATENAFSKRRFWTFLERLLERSDLPLRTVELAYLIAGSGLLLAMVAALTGQSAMVVLLMLGAGAAGPLGFVWFKAARRTKAFETQLPDVLITLAAAMKAGHSFKQGLQTVVDEGHPPASAEFKRVLAESRLGRPLDQALADMALRLGSKNFEFVITAVTIQQNVGGSLAGLIDMVADTVRQRQQFARKIKGLTAMGRAGAYVLIGLPFFMAGIITLVNPVYMDPLYHSSTGHKLIYTGLGMMAFGSLILKKIVSFKG